MAIRQDTLVNVLPPGQLGLAGVDLDHLAKLPVPSQPPPLVAAMRGGDQCHVTAVMTGSKLTADAIPVDADTLLKRHQRR
jgi:hypothetical protein